VAAVRWACAGGWWPIRRWRLTNGGVAAALWRSYSAAAINAVTFGELGYGGWRLSRRYNVVGGLAAC